MQVCSLSPQGNSVLLQALGSCVVLVVLVLVVLVEGRVTCVAHVLPADKHDICGYNIPNDSFIDKQNKRHNLISRLGAPMGRWSLQ